MMAACCSRCASLQAAGSFSFSGKLSQFTAETPQDAERAQRFLYLHNLCAFCVSAANSLHYSYNLHFIGVGFNFLN